MGTVLVVDDDKHILRVTSLWIARHGYGVLEAEDGAAAKTILQSQPVDLIVSDINMPLMDGLELLRFVRKSISSDIPYILLSSRCDQRELLDVVAPLDAQLFPKPFVPSQLVAEIGRLLPAPTP